LLVPSKFFVHIYKNYFVKKQQIFLAMEPFVPDRALGCHADDALFQQFCPRRRELSFEPSQAID